MIKTKIFFIFFSFLLIILNVKSQETKRSTIIETINGKRYYIHKVLKGETLYSIAKTYEVTVDAIAYENPGVFEGLKEGQELHIPIYSTPYKTLEYEVKKGETLYGIAKKHGVTIEELVQCNPSLASGIKEGQKIIIPIRDVASAEYKTVLNTKAENKDSIIKHKVNKGETVYGICKKYNITQEQLYEWNPALKASGLRVNDEIIVGKQEKTSLKQVQLEHKKVEEDVPAISNNHSKAAEIVKQAFSAKDTIKILPCEGEKLKKDVKVALFLSLQSDEQQIDEEDASTDVNFKLASKPYLEFYEGFLLAVDSLQRARINIELLQYDVKLDSSKLLRQLNDSKLKDVDLIIGPFNNDLFELVANWAYNYNIPVINPIATSNKVLLTHSNVIHINTTLNSQIEQLASYVARFDTLNVVLIETNEKEAKQANQLFLNKYVDLFKKYFKKNPLTKKLSYSEFNAIEKSLRSDIVNIVFIPSSSQVNVINLITKLNDLTRSYKIVLVYMPLWRKFEQNIELEHLFNLNSLCFKPFNIDYDNPLIKNFIINYRYWYKIEPSKYSFLGYDVAMYFISLVKKYGTHFYSCINENQVNLLSMQFYFEKISDKGAWENKGIFLTYYDNNTFTEKFLNVIKKENVFPLNWPVVEVRKIKK